MSNKIWYLPGPFHQYLEDVKALAKESGLRIIDANVTDVRTDEAESPPEVTVKDERLQLAVTVVGGDTALLQGMIDRLQTENEEIILLIDGLGAGEIHRPESGDLALRLFEVLGTIHASVVELTAERDCLLATVDSLRGEVEALKAAADQSAGDATEIEALKAKLDEAKVGYRANASKDSLEKLVADLPKA